LCGLQNHNAYGCRKEPLWNFGPELCAAQVPDQSFFFIDEQIDQKTLKERASVAIITMTDGMLTAKQIEQEFRNIISNDTWRWSAKRIAENKYIMRFPSAKMVMEYSRFKLGMKSLDAQITVEPWASTIGAKGMLQQAWFKVRGIPPDQRSLRTIAKVGDLVGKTTAIDENTRFNTEYVRIKIVCREVEAIPESAEGCLGMHIYDFFYEREKNEKDKAERRKEETKVGAAGYQPSPKKQKTTHSKEGSGGKISQDGGEINTEQKEGRKTYSKGAMSWSAPGKVNTGKGQGWKENEGGKIYLLQHMNPVIVATISPFKLRMCWVERLSHLKQMRIDG
jgi:hypothetical protein